MQKTLELIQAEPGMFHAIKDKQYNTVDQGKQPNLATGCCANNPLEGLLVLSMLETNN